MSRSITATNLDEINASHLHEVVLVKMQFDTPVYAHSGIGTITYDSNDYLGVGDFGSVSNATETEQLRPASLTLQLSGVDSTLLTEALDSGNYGDVVTLYVGYRQDDGTLVDDPWLLWRGTYDFSTITRGNSNIVNVIVQHDLAVLDEVDSSRFTDEDQQSRFTGDTGFEYVTDMNNLKLQWGGQTVQGSGAGGSPRPGLRIR